MTRWTNYAARSRRSGEVLASEGARILGAHPRTLRRWAAARLCGSRSPVKQVRRDALGRYWFSSAELDKLACTHAE